MGLQAFKVRHQWIIQLTSGMAMKLIVGISLVFLLLFGWANRDSEGFQTLLYLVKGETVASENEPEAIPSEMVAEDQSLHQEAKQYENKVQEFMASGGHGGMRKCRVGSKTIYTDSSCPSGSNEQVIRSGTITVMEGNRNGADSNKTIASSGLENSVGEMREPSLREKRMQQIIDRY